MDNRVLAVGALAVVIIVALLIGLGGGGGQGTTEESAGSEAPPTNTTEQTSEEQQECRVSNLSAIAIANNDTVIVEFNADCQAEATVYLDGNRLGSAEVKPGENRLVFQAPIDLKGGQQFTVKIEIGGETYEYPVEVKRLYEALKIFPDSYVDASTGTLHVFVQNTGNWPATIVRIQVSSMELSSDNIISPEGGYPIVVEPGQKIEIVADVSGLNPAPGVAYTVTIYTEVGSAYTGTVYGK